MNRRISIPGHEASDIYSLVWYYSCVCALSPLQIRRTIATTRMIMMIITVIMKIIDNNTDDNDDANTYTTANNDNSNDDNNDNQGKWVIKHGRDNDGCGMGA